MERLTKRDKYNGSAMTCDGDSYPTVFKPNGTRGTRNIEILEKLCAYEDAEEKGRLIKLPFAVGDTVYYLTDLAPDIVECQVVGITISRDMMVICIEESGRVPHYVNAVHIGRNLFRTREEAEKAKQH